MAIIDLIYPKRCPVCLDALPYGGELICEPCRKKVRYVQGAVCYRCGKPLADESREYCTGCEKKKPPFIKGIAWAEYTSKYVRRMLSEVKYHGDTQLLDFPCKDMAERFEDEVRSWGAEVIIPVPVHFSRRMVRGYNQAEEIAKRLGEVWKLPVDPDFLIRAEKTEAQKKLTGEKRAENLRRAFQTDGPFRKYRRVILVDDIYTTGSTMIACTRALMAAGVEEVYTAVLATGRDR